MLVVLPTLAALAIWGAIGRLLSWRRKRPLGAGTRWAGQVALAGFVAFVLQRQ
jgi:CHASE2 domain-containing sensor protein